MAKTSADPPRHFWRRRFSSLWTSFFGGVFEGGDATMKILFFDREFGFWGFKQFHDEVNAGTWLKPGARGCKTKERSYKCAEVFALPLMKLPTSTTSRRRLLFTAD
jgi:hypothetical protein